MTSAPLSPAGEYVAEPFPTPSRRDDFIDEIAGLPAKLAGIVRSMNPVLIDQQYCNWTARQIVHHLADSHANANVRFRLALTEESPTIKPYLEGKWAELPDAKSADLEISLTMLTAIHHRWTRLMKSMTDDQWQRTYVHPEYGKTFKLIEALGMYAHHGRHHAAQLAWMVENRSA